jgi:hypothetical protein
MNHTLVYLLSGKAGVGKSFAANLIMRYYNNAGNYNCTISPFANGVKQTARFMGWNGKKDTAGRDLLQKIGQIGRAYNEDVWVDKTMNELFNNPNYPFDVVIVDDWRFPNEFNHIKNLPLYKIVALRISAADREILIDNPQQYNEISETSLDSFELFDYVIENPTANNMYLPDCLHDIVCIETVKNRS